MEGSNDTLSRRTVLTGIATGGVVSISGCSALSPPPVGDIEVGVVDVRAPDVGLTSLTLPLVLEFHNTADDRVPDCTANFDVLINDVSVATAGQSIGTLGPGDRTDSRMDVTVDYGDISQQIVAAIEEGVFTILLDGDIHSEGSLPFVDSATQGIRVGYQVG